MEMKVRPARFEDSEFVYRLSMSPDVRLASTRTRAFSAQEHQEWWTRRFTDSVIFIGELDGRLAGYVRYGRAHNGDIEVAIALLPEARGRGLATKLLQESDAAVSERFTTTRRVALVVVGNDESAKLFGRNGFVWHEHEIRMGKMHWRYER